MDLSPHIEELERLGISLRASSAALDEPEEQALVVLARIDADTASVAYHGAILLTWEEAARVMDTGLEPLEGSAACMARMRSKGQIVYHNFIEREGSTVMETMSGADPIFGDPAAELGYATSLLETMAPFLPKPKRLGTLGLDPLA